MTCVSLKGAFSAQVASGSDRDRPKAADLASSRLQADAHLAQDLLFAKDQRVEPGRYLGEAEQGVKARPLPRGSAATGCIVKHLDPLATRNHGSILPVTFGGRQDGV